MTTYSVETASGIVTSWLPLTTAFSAPSACFTGIYSQQGDAGQLIAFDPFFFQSVDLSFTACFPQQATQWWDGQGLPTDPLNTVTSLGPFECPGGYTTVFTTEYSPASTQIACCPSGYDYQGSFVEPGTVGECWSTPIPGSTMQYFTLTDSGPWSETSTVLGFTHVAGVQINGWNLAALTQPSAAASSTTATASESSSQTSADSSTASASSSATSVSSASTSTKSSFPVGAVAGGVGGGVAVIILLIVAAYFFGRKRRFGQGSRYRIQEHYPDSPSTQHLAHQPSNHMAPVPLDNITERARPTGHQNNMAASVAAAHTTRPRYDKKGVLITEPLQRSGTGSVAPKKTSGSGVKKSSKPKTSSPSGV